MTSRILNPFHQPDESSPEDQTPEEESSPMPGWNPSPPPRPRPQDPADERATVLDPEDGDESGAGSAPSSAGESSPAFTDDEIMGLGDRVQLGTAIVGTVLAAGSGVLNDRLGDGPDDETWLMEPDEVETIATPLARIGARRVPLPGGSQASDMADLITAGAGLLGYVLRNLQERSMRRRALRGYGLPEHPSHPAAAEPEPVAEPVAEPARDVTTSLLNNRPTGGTWGL